MYFYWYVDISSTADCDSPATWRTDGTGGRNDHHRMYGNWGSAPTDRLAPELGANWRPPTNSHHHRDYGPSNRAAGVVTSHSVLTITDSRKADEGAYTCEALNAKGSIFAVPDTIVHIVRKYFYFRF